MATVASPAAANQRTPPAYWIRISGKVGVQSQVDLIRTLLGGAAMFSIAGGETVAKFTRYPDAALRADGRS